MEKLEYDKIQKIMYRSEKKTPFLVDVPKMNYLIFDGIGHPSEPDFQIACEALYTISYLVKFECARKVLNLDYKVNPMEVSWFLKKGENKIDYTWSMMIMQPAVITQEMIQSAIRIGKDRGKTIETSRVRFEAIEFGTCVQCFHRGDYGTMNETLLKMKNYAKEKGLCCDLYTHDIYLNDSRKTKISNYKTIMRSKAYPI